MGELHWLDGERESMVEIHFIFSLIFLSFCWVEYCMHKEL